MVLILSLLACLSVEGEDIEFVTDDSYKGIPELQQVSAACSGDALVVRGRSVGWTEEGWADVWDGAGARTGRKTASVAYTRDEYCDIFEVEFTEEGFDCVAWEAGGVSVLLRMQYEMGCAGIKAWGAVEEMAIYGLQIEPAPEEEKADCSLAETELVPSWYEDVEVADEITRCSEPVE